MKMFLCVLLGWSCLSPVKGFDQAYWVWKRTWPLQADEALVGERGSNALQIDYESLDRLIGEYVDFLRQLKEQGRSWQLSISALDHW